MYLYRTAVRAVDTFNRVYGFDRFAAKVFRTTPPDDKFDAIDVEFYVADHLFYARTFAVAEGDDLYGLTEAILEYLFECEALAKKGDDLTKDENFARGWDSITC